MRKYLLYGHGGSANHGCEALVRTTVSLLNEERENIILSSFGLQSDLKYGIDDICQIKKRGLKKPTAKLDIRFMKAYIDYRFNNIMALDDLYEINALGLKKNDIALSIGGDNYCYGCSDIYVKENRLYRSYNIKTVLWGCSIEPKLLNDEMIAEDIRGFDLITARESISYEALKKVNPNTILVCDSAFLLKTKDVSLPVGAENCDLVGVNLSPMVEENELVAGITRKNYYKLIDKIINETDMKILLIPHVVFNNNDDRTVLKDIYNRYVHTHRVYLIEDCNCEGLKGYISKCRFFIGARTHSTIAAYSNCVPTLVVGYSVKAKGIARDLFGTEDNYVIPVQSLTADDTLVRSFDWLLDNEQSIKSHLCSIMPVYKKRIDKAISALAKL